MANIEDVNHLLKVMKQLRDPVKGCAWDLEQDHISLIPYLEEESHELIEAITVSYTHLTLPTICSV